MQREFMATHSDWLNQVLFDKDKKKYWNEWQNRFTKQPDWDYAGVKKCNKMLVLWTTSALS